MKARPQVEEGVERPRPNVSQLLKSSSLPLDVLGGAILFSFFFLSKTSISIQLALASRFVQMRMFGRPFLAEEHVLSPNSLMFSECRLTSLFLFVASGSGSTPLSLLLDLLGASGSGGMTGISFIILLFSLLANLLAAALSLANLSFASLEGSSPGMATEDEPPMIPKDLISSSFFLMLSSRACSLGETGRVKSQLGSRWR